MRTSREDTALWADSAKRNAMNGDYERAATFLVCSQVRAAAPHTVWRWWKRSFGKRKDYPEMTQRLVQAILQEYHTGGELFRQTVAKMFGKRKAAARLPTNKFADAISRNKLPNIPRPKKFIPISSAPAITLSAKKYRYPTLPVRQNGDLRVDLRKDAQELRKLLATLIEWHTIKASKLPQKPELSAIAVGYHLCQAGWVAIHFDSRQEHKRDGTNVIEQEIVKIPAWKKAHDIAQREGGTIILPSGKTLKVAAGISCKRMAAIYGAMVKTVLIDAKNAGMFAKLSLREKCQLDIEKFDGLWAWPKFDQMGKTNLA